MKLENDSAGSLVLYITITNQIENLIPTNQMENHRRTRSPSPIRWKMLGPRGITYTNQIANQRENVCGCNQSDGKGSDHVLWISPIRWQRLASHGKSWPITWQRLATRAMTSPIRWRRLMPSQGCCFNFWFYFFTGRR